MTDKPGLDTIRDSYFGHVSSLARSTKASVRGCVELTPTAKFILTETKKRLGQQSLDAKGIGDESSLQQVLRHVESEEGEELSPRERAAAVAALSASREDFDILSPLIELPGVNDIIVRNYRDISVQVGRKNTQTDLSFSDHCSYTAFVENILKRAGKSCTLATPVVDVGIDARVRVCVTHESFSPPGDGPMLTIRIARHARASLELLSHQGLAPTIVLEYLAALIRSGQVTLLIAGEVGTGKTTLVRALSSRIRDEDALLIIEDTHEIALDRPFTRTLLTREANTEGVGRISPGQAIRTGMRMAMNRVILGEMRDAEAAEAFIDVCASGHAGISTIHARSARDALQRLELFLLRAQGGVGVDTVRRQVANALSLVVYLGLDPKQHKRRILTILEVGSASDGAIQVTPAFSFCNKSELPEWTRDSGVSLYQDILRDEGLEHLPAFRERISFEADRLYHDALPEEG